MGGLRGIIGTFVARRNEPEAELVFWLNGLIAAAAGLAAWLKFDLSIGGAAVLSFVGFLVLLVSLLNPYSAVVAGALGSLASGGVGALLGASLGLRYGGAIGAWVGGLVASAGLFVVAASSYRKLVRSALASRSRVGSPTPRIPTLPR